MTPGIQADRIKIVVRRRDRVASPVVEVGPSWLPGRFMIIYPLSLLSDEPDDVVLGTLGHEYQHVVWRDGKVMHRVGDVMRQVVFLGGCAVLGLVLPVIPFLVLPDLAATAAWVVLVSTELLGLVWWARHVCARPGQPEDLARSRHAELRCDLAAVHTVGRGPVLQMLRHGGSLDGQSHLPLAERTHPPVELRISAVRAYDVRRDPGEVAEEVLRHGRAEPDFSRWHRRRR